MLAIVLPLLPCLNTAVDQAESNGINSDLPQNIREILEEYNPIGYAPRAPVNDARARMLLDLISPDGMASRTAVAEVIIPALNYYFRDHGEYPPFLFGGSRDVGVNMYTPLPRVRPSPDPLIEGGYLNEYPQTWLDYKWFPDCCVHSRYDNRDHDYWLCMFSTPDDFLVLDAAVRDIKDGGITDGLGSSWTPESGLAAQDGVLDWLATQPMSRRREFALGGFVETLAPETFDLGGFVADSRFEYVTIEPDVDHSQYRFLYGDLPYFGYQRGEWLSADESECWLWLYGHTSWAEAIDHLPRNLDEAKALMERPNFIVEWPNCFSQFVRPVEWLPGLYLHGLDLVNSATQTIEPDGIPDYISLLYKLKDGAVVEVVRAEDM